jgi:hypothetical protein
MRSLYKVAEVILGTGAATGLALGCAAVQKRDYETLRRSAQQDLRRSAQQDLSGHLEKLDLELEETPSCGPEKDFSYVLQAAERKQTNAWAKSKGKDIAFITRKGNKQDSLTTADGTVYSIPEMVQVSGSSNHFGVVCVQVYPRRTQSFHYLGKRAPTTELGDSQ